MRKLNVYVVIDLERLGKASDTPQVYGSMKELVSANIVDKGEVLTYAALVNRLSKNSDIHYWKNDRYIICKREVKRAPKKDTVLKTKDPRGRSVSYFPEPNK